MKSHLYKNYYGQVGLAVHSDGIAGEWLNW